MRNPKLIILIFSLIVNLKSYTQISTATPPLSYSSLITDSIKNVALPTISLPKLNIDSLLIQDSLANREEFKFGFIHEVEINFLEEGQWDTLIDGSRICRLLITSEDAAALYLVYNNFWLPTGATFHIYTPNQSMSIGAFTEENNDVSNKFATQLVAGDSSILEYHEPITGSGEALIQISQVIHDYKNILGFPTEGFHGNADLPCHINAACISGWENEKRSVGLIVVGSSLCSGAMIGNTNNDGTPYFLTAFHCFDVAGVVADGVLDNDELNNANSSLVYFNHEAGNCGDNTYHNLHSLAGCVYLSGSPNTDFALVRFNSSPPPEWGVHYAGWSREIVPANSGAGIHHPGGDIKKISIENDPVSNVPYTLNWLDSPSTPPNTHWQLNYDQGVTEGGSSGSPFFNENGMIVGQLHGGPPADCSGSSVKQYGRFDVSWEGDGTIDTRLKDYLDPTSTNVITWTGWDLTCNNTMYYSEIINSGQTVVRKAHIALYAVDPYIINSGGNVTFEAGERIEILPGFEAKSGSVFHAYITPVDLTCTPPPTIELFNAGNSALACFPYVIGSNSLHGQEPYQSVTLYINGAVEGFQTFVYSPGDVMSYLPAPDDHFSYWAVLTDANGYSSINSNTVGTITVVPSGLSCNKSSVSFDDSLGVDSENNEVLISQETLYNPEFDFFIHPNPTSGQFFVLLTKEMYSEINVYDPAGKLISQQNCNGQTSIEFQLMELPAGIYYVSITTGDTIITKKVAIN